MTWRTDERTLRTFGPHLSVVSQVRDNETAHLITVDGHQLRVLPSESLTGKFRSQVVQGALKMAEAHLMGVSEDVRRTYVEMSLSQRGLEWENV